MKTLKRLLKIYQIMNKKSKRAEEAALKAYPRSDFQSVETSRKTKRKCFIGGYEQAEQDIISLIESRIAEIMGDAQPAPVLRIELRELINKIKEK